MMHEIHTDRLVLRPFQAVDATRVTAAINDPRIYRNVGRIKPGQSEDETSAWIATHPSGMEADTDHVLAIVHNGLLVGAIGAHRRRLNDVYETGYWIAPDAWGHGYATEAASALIGWLETTRGARATISGHFADNPASGRVLAKLGYMYAGRSTMFCMGRNTSVQRRDMARIA